MRKILPLLLVLTTLVAYAPAQNAAPEKVQQAIDKGKQYLYAEQNADGHWESVPAPKQGERPSNDLDETQWGGRTAICVYALLVSGEKATEPRLAKAIELLQKQTMGGTYVVAVKCLVWLQMPQTPEVKAAMRRDAKLLIQLAKKTRDGKHVVWDYGPEQRSSAYSLSRTQYAALGLWAASETDVEVPLGVWREQEKTWLDAQTSEGGWKYMFDDDITFDTLKPTTVSMTAAAIATLYTVQDITKAEFYAGAKGNAVSPPIEKGLAWIAAHFDERVAKKPAPPREYTYSQLYHLERAGLASGLRRFGEHDWYGRGAAFLLEEQKSNGSWGYASGNMGSNLTDTCFALLFLQRGRTPVAFNKLDYSNGVADAKEALWNQRPRDVANVTRWLSRQLERELRWQIVRADAGLDAWLESPILYIAGASALELTAETKAQLKAYMEHGGVIVAHADVGNTTFGKSIMQLGAELLPPNEFRDLPDDHPIHANQNYKRSTMKSRLPVRGISNGVREMMILLPTGDPARAWQLRRPEQKTEAWQTAANIHSYAINTTTYHARGESWLIPEPTQKPARTVTVGQLKYEGDWNPEPQALTQLSRYAITLKQLGLDVKTIDAAGPIGGVDLLYVTGTRQFVFGDATRNAIKDYVAQGGTVLFEAAGGSGPFATSAEVELTKMFGKAPPLIPASHSIYEGFKPTYRPYNVLTIGNPAAPALRAVEQEGRLAALLSREDLSAGWLGVPHDGIVGYTPGAARELGLRILTNLK